MAGNKQKQPKAETSLAFKVFVSGAASIIWLIVTTYLIQLDLGFDSPLIFVLLVLLLNVPAIASYYLLKQVHKHHKIDKENMRLYTIVIPTLTYFMSILLIYYIIFWRFMGS